MFVHVPSWWMWMFSRPNARRLKPTSLKCAFCAANSEYWVPETAAEIDGTLITSTIDQVIQNHTCACRGTSFAVHRGFDNNPKP
jgi:hypothetical protein